MSQGDLSTERQSGRPTPHQRLRRLAPRGRLALARRHRVGPGVVADLDLPAIIERLPSGVVVLDASGRAVLANESARLLLGLDPASLLPAPDVTFELRDPHTGQPLPRERTASARALAGEEVAEGEVLYHVSDSQGVREHWVHSSAVPLRDAAGHRAGALTIFSDVSGQRRLVQQLAASEARTLTVLEHVPVVLFATDAAGVVTLAAGPNLERLGLAAEGVLGRSIFSLPLANEEFQGRVRRALGGQSFTTTIRRADGLVYETRYSPIRDAAGALIGMVGVALETTERVRAEDALRASEERYRTLLEGATDVVIVVTATGMLTYVSPAIRGVLGFAPDDLRGRSAFDLLHPAEVATVRRSLARGATRQLECRARHANGSWRWIEYRVRDARADPAIAGFICNGRDVTDRHHVEEELRHEALHDPLTGLPNRSLFQDRLDQALLVGHRLDQPVAVLLLDLNHFKEINDTFGHDHGDTLLREVAHRLRHAARAVDTVARLGGDEFALLLPDADQAGAMSVVAKVTATLATPLLLAGQSITPEASIGVAVAPDHGPDAAALLRRADLAMYAAKRANQPHAVYTPRQDSAAADRLALIADLRLALATGALALHYQPKMDLASGQIRGVEALARWLHPTRGLILPDQFVPLAEGAGLIGPLARWTLREALRQHRVWRDGGLIMLVAVNLSARNLADGALPATVADLLREFALPAEALRLEITESALIADPLATQRVLGKLHALGVPITVDDFGTGQAGLAYLKGLPVDELKINRSAAPEAEERVILAATISLAHSLGLRVVAEGVEEAAIWEHLIALGCDVAQGYFFSHPLSAADLEDWLRATP